MRRAMPLLLVAAAVAAGCGKEFAPFNELDKLRVLAVRAEPPEIAPGEAAAIDALVFEPDGDEVAYSWSWCPFTLGALDGYECAVTEQELAEAIEAVAPGAGSFVPSFDLGDGPSAAFANLVPPAALDALCEAIASDSAPAFVDLPECGDRLVVTIRLDVAAGGETATAVKELPLLFEAPAEPNANPAIGEIFAAPAADGADPLVAGAPLEFEPQSALRAETLYDLGADVEDAASQLFTPAATDDDPDPEPRRETLFMTWFVTGGETDSMRTGFIEDDADMDDLVHNGWRTPELVESGGEAQLFLVLQDERGGVGWTARSVALEEE
ncbi:MAG: hypothetical protein M0R80_31530 [Proteobacteria bacterium]|nr:hypothetical protein [Pseudomonadota bacterium]